LIESQGQHSLYLTAIPSSSAMNYYRKEWKRKVFALLPLGILVIAFATILAAYRATFSTNLLDFQQGRVKTPPISMLMFDGAGRRIGQVGFPLVSWLFGWISPTFYRAILDETSDNSTGQLRDGVTIQKKRQKTVRILKVSSTIAFVCLALVGAIPLQANLSQVMQRQAPMSMDSIIHQSAAALFFLFCIIHMATWLFFCRFRASAHHYFYYQNSPVSFRFKATCLILCFFPLPTAFLLHPISPLRKGLALSEADAGGITQYALVACVSSFFASYSLEMWHHVTNDSENEKIRKQTTSSNTTKLE